MMATLDPRIRRVLVSRLYVGLRGFHALGALTAGALVLLVWPQAEPEPLLGWLAFMVACHAALGAVAFAFRRWARQNDAERWLLVYGILYLTVSAGWGASAWLLIAEDDQWQLVAHAAVLVGVCAVSMNPLSNVAHLYAAGTLLMVGPAVGRLLVEAQSASWATAGIAGMCAAAGIALLSSAYRNYRAHAEDIRAQAVLEEAETALAYERARLREAEDRLRLGGAYDPLTNTLSYSGIREVLAERIAAERPTLIACVNIDDFKRINDAFGLHVGDLVLRTVGERLGEIAGDRNRVGRISADEFLVIAPDAAQAAPGVFSIRLRREIAQPVFLEGRSVDLAVGVGLARYPDHGADAKDLMECAILAMRSAKTAPERGYRIYSRGLRDQARGSLSLRLELARALERGELRLHYQPIVHLRSGAVVGAEALLRWRNERLGDVPPERFIPVAEQSGLIEPIGNWIIGEAAAAAARLRALLPVHISINASLRQFGCSGRLADELATAIDRHGIPPAALHLELTETTFMSNPDAVRRVLHAVRELGVPVVLDDFGTGFSALGYLRHMNIDGIKLDRGFTAGIGSADSERQTAIVRSVLNLAHGLDMWVVAEGVEQDRQRRWFSEAGCAYAQGHLFARSMPEAAFARWAQNVLPPLPVPGSEETGA